MKATQNKSRPVHGVIDALVGGSSGEPVAGAAATAVQGAEGAATAVTGSGKGSKKSGRPQASPKQGDSATAVQRLTRKQRGEQNSQRMHAVQAEEQTEQGRSQQLWVGNQQLTGEEFRLATIQQAKGRPSEYTEDKGMAICDWIRQGKSLNSYCKQAGMGIETPYRWLRTYPSFRESYAQAQEDRADTMADQLLAVADDLPPDATMEQVQIAKLRLDARKWIASKLRPGKWGDKQVVEHTGGGINIQIGIPQKPTAVLEATDVQAKRLK